MVYSSESSPWKYTSLCDKETDKVGNLNKAEQKTRNLTSNRQIKKIKI